MSINTMRTFARSIKSQIRSCPSLYMTNSTLSITTNNSRLFTSLCSSEMRRSQAYLLSHSSNFCTSKEGEAKVDDSAEKAEKVNEEPATPATPDAPPKPEELIASLQKEIKDLKEQVLRSYAEEENVRRIARRDVENAKTYANTSFAKSMLEVADDLERALAIVSSEKKAAAGASGESTLASLVLGIEMTDKNLQKIFGQFGVKKFAAAGEPFDPTMHDALFQIPDSSKPAGTIGQVLKHGYKLKDRVIRAAQVGTVVHPGE